LSFKTRFSFGECLVLRTYCCVEKQHYFWCESQFLVILSRDNLSCQLICLSILWSCSLRRKKLWITFFQRCWCRIFTELLCSMCLLGCPVSSPYCLCSLNFLFGQSGGESTNSGAIVFFRRQKLLG